MHDWWLACVAALTGSIRYIPKRLVKYRQHAGNVIGAKGFWGGLNIFSQAMVRWRSGNREFESTFRQAEKLYSHGVEKKWAEKSLAPVDEYRNIPNMSRQKRLIAAFRMGLRKEHLLLRTVFFIRLLSMPKGDI